MSIPAPATPSPCSLPQAEGQSVLVFCVSRRACEACAALLTDRLGSRRPEDLRLTLARQELLADMRGELGGEPTPGLSDCILHGGCYGTFL